MSSRDLVLSRIRSALRKVAPKPPVGAVEPIFQKIPEQDRLERFKTEFTALKGEWLQVRSVEEARVRFGEWIRENDFKRVVVADDPFLQSVTSDSIARTLNRRSDYGHSLGKEDVGVTSCVGIVARTGSLVLTANASSGRILSVLPPTHLVIARRSRIWMELSDAFSALRMQFGTAFPSMITFISGPSRTADIEKILVMGAHGPKRLVLLLIDDC